MDYGFAYAFTEDVIVSSLFSRYRVHCHAGEAYEHSDRVLLAIIMHSMTGHVFPAGRVHHVDV